MFQVWVVWRFLSKGQTTVRGGGGVHPTPVLMGLKMIWWRRREWEKRRLLIIHSQISSLIDQYINILSTLFIYSFIHSSIYSFIHSYIHSFIHLVILSFIHSFIYSLIYLDGLDDFGQNERREDMLNVILHSSIHTYIHSCIHISIHLFIYRLIIVDGLAAMNRMRGERIC